LAARKYAEEAPKSIAAFDGQYVVRGGKIQTLEGAAPKCYINNQADQAKFHEEPHSADRGRCGSVTTAIALLHAPRGVRVCRRRPGDDVVELSSAIVANRAK
jgi:hypothetical protein